MKLVKLAAVAATAALAFGTLTSTEAEAKKKRVTCASTTGEGTAVTANLARTNASNALKALQTRLGMKGSGKVKMECKSTAVVLTNCTATQRACK